MGGLATQVGVSRQTVYNEVGTKTALAEAMVLRELDRFLAVVSAAFDAEDELPAAIERAVRDVLVHARDNTLLHAVVSATHGADTELLPLLTTNSSALLEGAKAVVRSYVAPYEQAGDLAMSGALLDAGVDMVVRVVLSHVMAPSGTPDETAAALADLTCRALGI